MNQFIQKLKAVAGATAPAMGFLAAARTTTKSGPLLIAVLAVPDRDVAKTLIKAGADMLMLRSDDAASAARVTKLAKDVPCGVAPDVVGAAILESLKDAACDFLVFSTASTPIAALRLDGVARVARVQASSEMSALRGLEQVGADALLLESEAGKDFVTVQYLMACYAFSSVLRKPLIAWIPETVSREDVRALWDAGVDALVVEADPEKTGNIRMWIESLPPRAKRKADRETALLPRLADLPEELPERPEEE